MKRKQPANITRHVATPSRTLPGSIQHLYPALLVLMLMSITAGTAKAEVACGSLENAYGPFDYTNPVHFNEMLGIVENRHFNIDVEQLKKGGSTGSLVKDLDYVLRAFPNHHRALYAMARYQLKAGGRADAPYTMECYFDRAMRMNQTDGMVRMLYGIYLHRKHEYQNALSRYNEALKLIPESQASDLHYNMGLLYVSIKDYDAAMKHARLAYESNYPLPSLRNQLKKLGVWKQPEASQPGDDKQ